MIKTTINVPASIRYMTDWEKLEGGYSLNDYPFPHILDKQITGCGFTEYCIRNGMNIVICSPRRILLENKFDQHPEPNVFYFRNDIETLDFDCDLLAKPTAFKGKGSVEAEIIKETPEEMNARLLDEEAKFKQIETIKSKLEENLMNNSNNRLPSKILVTYDSFRHVKDVLVRNNILEKFFIVIDEFQSIFVDSRFKSSTEMELLDQLQEIKKVCFVSATPMIDHYLEMLDEFKDLPYYEFDWAAEDQNRIIRPDIVVHPSKSVIYDINNVIKSYLDGQFETYTFRDSSGELNEVVANEAVVYVNSVKNICDIIKRCGLTPDNTNVLCANTKENLRKIKLAFKASCGRKDGGIGSIPKYGEPHKMFTLCTRTVYLGADFYSVCARSFIVSDANIDTLSVDITMDLPQILGRQRLLENPWKNRVELYFKPIGNGKKMTKEYFDGIIQQKLDDTMELLDIHKNLTDPRQRHLIADRYEKLAKSIKYKDDFVAVNKHTGSDLMPVLNKLVMVSEMRTFDIQQIDYKDRVSVLNTVSESYNVKSDVVDSLLQEFENAVLFTDKMKLICTSGLDQYTQSRLLSQVPMTYSVFYNVIGPERIKELRYRRDYLMKELNNIKKSESNSLADCLSIEFQVGEKYSRTHIKEKLAELYKKEGLTKTPKAVDLLEYFELREVLLYRKDGSGKRDKGYEILGIKKRKEL